MRCNLLIIISYLLLFNRLRFCLSLNRRCDTLDLISTVVSDSCINVESGPPLSIWCTRLTNIMLPGLHCFVFPSPSLLSLSSPSSKSSAVAGISHGIGAPQRQGCPTARLHGRRVSGCIWVLPLFSLDEVRLRRTE